MQACDRCHARKTRCDRALPKCSSCQKAGQPCLHTDKLQQRNYPRGYIEDIETKLKGLERENARLRNGSYPRGDSMTSPTTQHVQPTATPPAGSLQSPPMTAREDEAPLVHGDRRGSTVNSRFERDTTPHLARPPSVEGSYLGSSGSVEFARIVQSVVDSANTKNNLFETASARNDGPKNPSPPVVPRDAPKPAHDVAMPLISTYFNHWAVSFPLLHRPSFMLVCESIYDDPGFYAHNLFEAFIFDMVLAMGSATANRHEWSVSGTETHFSRAMNKLDQVLGMKGILPLQALLFCCQYGVFASLRDTSAQMWHLLGIASRLSAELGLHRESSAYAHGGALRQTEPRWTPFEIEMRRRCFWCFYNLDR